MRHTVKTQMIWEDTIHTMRDYLMNTPIPLLFEELLQDPDLFGNQNWTDFMNPRPTFKNPNPKKFTRDSIHDFVWEHILKDTLMKAFRDRLLGSQMEPELYVQRSETYAALFNDMIGGQNCSNDLADIIRRFYVMVKDYLCRNLPGNESDYINLSTRQVLSACRDAYAARRWRDDTEGSEERPFFLHFGQKTFSLSLLLQFDLMAENSSAHPKSRHFMVLAELLQGLFIYVYMVEYIKYYPKCTDKEMGNLTYKERTGRELCLLSTLANVDYRSLFYEEKRKRDEAKKFMGK